MAFSETDLDWISSRGIKPADLLEQVSLFCRGASPIRLLRPARIGDGIVQILPEEKDLLIAWHHKAAGEGRMLKFVPASGAASRMFKDWYTSCLQGGFESGERAVKFLEDIRRLAFYDDLEDVVSRAGESLEDLVSSTKCVDLLEYILTPRGLNYTWLPKGLLKFHRYPGHHRTAMEEHLAEAAFYIRDGRNICRIHFTVSKEHENSFRTFFEAVRGRYEHEYNVAYEFSLSLQDPSTDTIAVDIENRPFRDRVGRLCFRPGGHGALLHNLNSIEGDIVFLKNIDNVARDPWNRTALFYKKILGGYLARLQDEIFRAIKVLDLPAAEAGLSDIARFCEEKLFVRFPPRFNRMTAVQQRGILHAQLNRPLRVCGMVRNEGEPGGGPFWTEGKDGLPSLQIVEQHEVDLRDQSQGEIWRSSTHFNPVDLVCGIRDYRSRKFDLNRYVNENAVCITRKTHEGADIKALELPGLWNGSMALWNTVFVEVPIETFNPVKTVDDLLRESHLSA
jgi:hypothetical protein